MVSDFLIRPGVPDDRSLVYNATAKSMRSSPYYADVPPPEYGPLMTEWVALRLASSRWVLLTAVVAEVPDEIAGFLLYRPGQPPALGMVYVKDPYRRRGCARLLLTEAGFRAGCRYPAVLGSPRRFALAAEKGLHLRISPYLL